MKKVNKPRILERLRAKYALTDVETELFRIEEVINLVEDMGELLKLWKCRSVGNFSRTAGAGTGVVLAYTIPVGKRYHVRTVYVIRNSGDGTLDHLYIKADNEVRVYSQSAAPGFDTQILTQDLILDENLEIRINVAAISTDSVWTISLYYAEEDAF